MGIFDLFKKKEVKKNTASDFDPLNGKSMINYIRSRLDNPTDENVLKVLQRISEPAEDLEHLTPEGDLPRGWFTENKNFIDKTNSEFSYFLKRWIDSRDGSPKELYSALKSFVLYMEDVKKVCLQKGECFEHWFNEILTSPGYLEKRKAELQKLTANLEELQKKYEHKSAWMPILDDEIIKQLRANDGILQSDFIKMFDEDVQADVSSKLYYMAKSGDLERIKSGRSYILHYKK